MKRTYVRLVVLSTAAALALSAIGRAADSASPPLSGVRQQPDDVAWAELEARLQGAPGKPAPGSHRNWEIIAREAQKLQETFPDSPRAASARRVLLLATIEVENRRSGISESTTRKVAEYRADKSVAARDRLEITIAAEQSRLRHARHPSREEGMVARLKHARDLIAEFPDEPEGYGYLLSLAKGDSASPGRARQLARELLASSAPDWIRQGAARVLARLELEGKPLRLGAASGAIEESIAKRRPIALYTWTVQDTGFLEIITRLANEGTADFIGINLDENRAAAETVLAQLKPPGKQLFDGAKLDGPLATQLQLVSRTNLYLVDRNGVVRDVNGHADFARKFAQVTGNPEGRK